MKLELNVKYGILAGGATIAYLLLFYLVNPKLMLNPTVLWSSLLIYLFFMFRACWEEQRKMENYSFRQALKSAFVVFVLANAMYYTYYFIMFNWLDPGLIEIQRELMGENLERFSGVLGEGNKTEMQRNILEDPLTVTVERTFLSFGLGLIGGFALSIGIAGIVRRL